MNYSSLLPVRPAAASLDAFERPLGKLIALAILVIVTTSLALASTDATFNTPVTWLNNALTGSLGKTIALASLAVGLGLGVVQQSVMSVVIGTSIALAASVGPGVLTGMLGAVL